ncbi:uncharacterized protein CEXT_259661, partial [Caerostris extrusa]
MSDVYVQVLYDFHYRTENGEEVTMKAGEELLLLKKSNENWWQVIRDSDNNPFYAPSNYLSIIGLNCKESIESTDVNSNIQSNNSSCSVNQNNIALKSKCIIDVQKNVNKLSKSVTENLSIKKVTDALSFKNPLCENEFLNNDHDHDDSYQKQVLLTNELPSKIECENEISTSYDSSLLQDSMSPIYVNIPVSFGRLPPSPKPDQKPIRKLTNDWFEYVEEESGRKYYFHSASGKVTWKPPRRHENMQSTPLSSEPSSPKSISSLNAVPDPPPKQLKPKLKKLAHSSNESLESQSSPCMFTILPPGWSEESDSNGAVYYHHGLSKKKWYASSADENGRTYFMMRIILSLYGNYLISLFPQIW